MKILKVFVALLLPILNYGQQIKPLTVGDRCPDLHFKYIINNINSSTSLSQLKGKLTILDFWEISCSSCIAALPKLQQLQNEFKDRVQIITVTSLSTREETLKRLKGYNKTANLKLPIVLQDRVLHKYFPFKLTSHVVWIDDEGIVRAITGTEYVTEKNIKTVLSGSLVNWPVKKDVIGFDYSRSFVKYDPNSSVSSVPFLYYSTITGHMEGIDGTNRQTKDSVNKVQIRNYFNLDLLRLSRLAIENATGGINEKKVLLEVMDSAKYLFDRKKEYRANWAKKNTFSYSLTLPINIPDSDVKKYERRDLGLKLKTIFGIEAKREKRFVNCLVLKSISADTSKLFSKTRVYNVNLSEDAKIKSLMNSPLDNLLWHLNEETSGIPWVINESGINDTTMVDMQLNVDSFQNIPALRKQLQKYGLDLIEEKRELEMYVITEKDWKVNAQSN